MPLFIPTDTDGRPCTLPDSKVLGAIAAPRKFMTCTLNISSVEVDTGCNPDGLEDDVQGGLPDGDYVLTQSGCLSWESNLSGVDNPAPMTTYNGPGCAGGVLGPPLYTRMVAGFTYFPTLGQVWASVAIDTYPTTGSAQAASIFSGSLVIPSCDGLLTGVGPFTIINDLFEFYTKTLDAGGGHDSYVRGKGGQVVISLSD